MSQYSSVFGDVDWVAYYKKRKPDLTEIKDGINDIKQSIANLECGGSGGGSSGGSSGGNTYAHKVEIKFNNFSLSYYGQEQNHAIFSFDFDSIANNSIGRGDVSVSGDLQELLNFYPIMLSPYSKEFKTACHVYLKDADTENLVEGIGISGSSSEGSRKVGILFNKGTQDKFFNNTIVLEWGLEVSSGGGEDKLLCYKIHIGNDYTYVVYTDKPATKIFAGETGGFEQSILPVDEGKHLFITNSVLVETTVDYAFSYLVYEDGSPSADLKGKFIEHSE